MVVLIHRSIYYKYLLLFLYICIKQVTIYVGFFMCTIIKLLLHYIHSDGLPVNEMT